MQHCSCRVFLAGSRNNDIPKHDVTVAEIAVLRFLHGDDSVHAIKRTYMSREAHGAEIKRLKDFFGPEVVERMWPGVSPRLPVKLSDIGITDEGVSEELAASVEDPEDTVDRVSRSLEAAQKGVAPEDLAMEAATRPAAPAPLKAQKVA